MTDHDQPSPRPRRRHLHRCRRRPGATGPVACPAFAGADLDTGLIERQKDFLFPTTQTVPRDTLLVATVGELLWEQHEAKQAAKTSGDPHSPWHARDGWRMNLSSARTISFRDGEALVDAHVRYQRDQWQIMLHGQTTLAHSRTNRPVVADGLVSYPPAPGWKGHS